ncbi:hypothetical protein BZA05DRAFT_1467 [Tricharina praecox]|uniref:uncharacterized protein n=1 Tax=Tricharina praecox TaxID=43433 RepID=UPI00221E542F|nr:uncharacterized protein BZA05DRAFT_1467 [Tricharina praecox]KAI5858376.1 hypothetical protein BZA05DRAFT_1467 [Tricharina praecox]
MSSPSTQQFQHPGQEQGHQFPPAPPNFQPFFTLISPTTSNPSHAHPHVHYIFSDDPTDPTLDLPPATPHTRVITVDLDVSADNSTYVRSAHALSRDFQLVAAEITEAPQMSEGGGGLMLVLEGVETGLRGVKVSQGVQELARMFDERMDVLRRVVGFGGVETAEVKRAELHPSYDESTADETVTETEDEG